MANDISQSLLSHPEASRFYDRIDPLQVRVRDKRNVEADTLRLLVEVPAQRRHQSQVIQKRWAKIEARAGVLAGQAVRGSRYQSPAGGRWQCALRGAVQPAIRSLEQLNSGPSGRAVPAPDAVVRFLEPERDGAKGGGAARSPGEGHGCLPEAPLQPACAR